MRPTPPRFDVDTRAPQFGALRFQFQQAPATGPAHGVLIAVHGVRRNVLEHAEAFSAQAWRARCHLLIPHFDAQRYPDYQRLGRPGRGQRADLHLIALVAHLAREFDFDASDLRLFGHSGGAQFVHRFAMAHPDLVRRYALSAAGWYTFPDARLAFPMGTAHPPETFPRLEACRFLPVPGRVFVGRREHAHSRLLRHAPDLDAAQGMSRLDRARRWVTAMQTAARAHALDAAVDLVELADGAHSFSGLVRRTALVQHVVEFLVPESAGHTPQRSAVPHHPDHANPPNACA